MLKEYKQKRRQAVELYKYVQEEEYIRRVAALLLKEHINSQKVFFFIRECREMRDCLLKKVHDENLIVSSKLHEAISNQNINDLYDCVSYSGLLKKVYNEQTNRILFVVAPGIAPVTLIELGTAIGVSVAVMYVLAML